jgi:hypothetical protein
MKAAEALFGEFQPISNEVHQGLMNMNEVLLGCHLYDRNDPERVFPFVLRADIPAYLVKGRPNLGENEIEALGFTQRSQRLGVYNRLKHANILPHGAGYTFPDLLNVSRVLWNTVTRGISRWIRSPIAGRRFSPMYGIYPTHTGAGRWCLKPLS